MSEDRTPEIIAEHEHRVRLVRRVVRVVLVVLLVTLIVVAVWPAS